MTVSFKFIVSLKNDKLFVHLEHSFILSLEKAQDRIRRKGTVFTRQVFLNKCCMIPTEAREGNQVEYLLN